MAQLKVTIKGQRLVIREGEDRNGPGMSVLRTDKGALVSAIQDVTSIGDTEFVTGHFQREEDHTASPHAMFRLEADADAYLVVKGNTFRKIRRTAADGFDYVIERKP